jgi:RNA polymerase sigma factor (sigma-70 family)
MRELALSIQAPRGRAGAGRLSSDERLARLVSKGSEAAFAALYQRHHQALYRYCRSIVRDEEDAQDALQSAMTRALVALRAEERDLAVRPWLFRIVHNEAVSILRRRRPTTPLAEELEPADLGLERTVEGRRRLATLVTDLQALPERQRAALLMREMSGLSIQEIAVVLSTSPGATKQLVFEARRALHDFAEGRAMECEQVRQAISDGDRRVLRARKLRGHMRECSGCRAFEVAISTRSADMQALAPPLPGVAAAAMLGRLLSHGAGGSHLGGVAAGSGAVIGNSAAASLTAKSLAGLVAAVAVAGGAHLALVHGQHSHSTSRLGSRVTSPGSATAARHPPARERDARTSATPGAAVAKRRAAAGATGVTNDSAAASARSGIGPIPNPNGHPETGNGSSHTLRGHGKASAGGHNIAGRSRPNRSGSHRSGWARSGHGQGGQRTQSSAGPVTHAPQRGRGARETGGQPAAPAPASTGAKSNEMAAHLPAGTSQAGSGVSRGG